MINRGHACPSTGLTSPHDFAGTVGLLLGAVGSDARTGFPRWDFGNTSLLSGVDLAVLAMAFFAVPELISLAVRRTSVSEVPPITDLIHGQLAGVRDAIRHWGTVIRGGVLGSLVSVIPGMGGSVIGWLAYGVTVQTSRDKSRFGRGDVRGVIGPDSAANASEGGHLIPTLGFGVPSTGGMAFLLVVFTSHGIQTGPSLLTTRLEIIYFFVIGIVVAHIIGALVCFFSANQLAKLSYAPYYFLVAFFIPVLFLSAYQSTLHFTDVVYLVLMALLAYVLRQFGWPRPPLLVGFVLSNQLESNLNSSVSIYGGFGWVFRPIVLGIAALILIGLCGPMLWRGVRAAWGLLGHGPAPQNVSAGGWRGRRGNSRPGQHAGGGSTVTPGDTPANTSTDVTFGERTPVSAGGSALAHADTQAGVATDAALVEPTPVSAGRRRISWFGSLDLVLTLALMAGIGLALWQATSWPDDAKRFPLVFGAATMALLAVQVFNRLRTLNDEEVGGRLAFEMPSAMAHVGMVVARRSVTEFGWLIGLLVAVWLLDFEVVMPCFTFAYLRLVGRVRWRYCLLSAVGFTLFEWALFDQLADLYWYRGVLSTWLESRGIYIGF